MIAFSKPHPYKENYKQITDLLKRKGKNLKTIADEHNVENMEFIFMN